MHIIQSSICRQAAAWMIDTEVFCEGHKEGIIEVFGVDHFPIRRLTESDELLLRVAASRRIARRGKRRERRSRLEGVSPPEEPILFKHLQLSFLSAQSNLGLMSFGQRNYSEIFKIKLWIVRREPSTSCRQTARAVSPVSPLAVFRPR